MRYLLGLLIVMPFLIGVMRREAGPADPTTAKNEEILRARQKAVEIGKEMVLKILKDPDSAKFGNVFFGRNATVCGTVNSKNSFGGYTGAQVFTIDAKYVRFGNENAEAVAAWKQNCAR